jgi:hypothetical protein
MAEAAYDAGSYRDPASAVFTLGERVLRGLDERSAEAWQRLAQTRFLADLVDRGKVVPSEPVQLEDVPLSPRGQPWALVLEHERVPVVSYPYEWPFAMLRAAALCQLDVLDAALGEGWSLKDGTAYNLQFVGPRPLFVDVGSFEPEQGPWPGYRQFCETMLFPLMLQAHQGVAFQPLLRGRLDGVPTATMDHLVRGTGRLRPGVLRHVLLHSLVERRSTAGSEEVKRDLRSAGFTAELSRSLVRGLHKLVVRLEVGTRRSEWSGYYATCSYSDEDTAAKRRLVETEVAARSPATLVDLGANDGTYSVLVAPHAGCVVAVDGDEQVVDRLWRRLAGERITNVLPLVVDLADPSPGLGWRNRERRPFESRVRADMALALALVHHLVIGRNLPLGAVVDWLADTAPVCIVEFPHRDDPMVRRLLANKPAGLFDDYEIDAFEAALDQRFEQVVATRLPGGTRTLYVVERSA